MSDRERVNQILNEQSDAIRDLHLRKEIPGWEYENVQDHSEKSAYGVVKDASGKVLFDTINAGVAEIHTEHDGEGGVYRWDEVARKNLTIAAASPELLNALLIIVSRLSELPAGVPEPLDDGSNAWDGARNAIRKAYGIAPVL